MEGHNNTATATFVRQGQAKTNLSSSPNYKEHQRTTNVKHAPCLAPAERLVGQTLHQNDVTGAGASVRIREILFIKSFL